MKNTESRNVAIALGIICAILSLGIIVLVVDYTSTLNIEKSTVWVNSQTVSSLKTWTFSAKYAGYVSVNVEDSPTNTTYVLLSWYAFGIEYGNKITVGTSGTAVFPVLPCADVDIMVGNEGFIYAYNETVTITYHY